MAARWRVYLGKSWHAIVFIDVIALPAPAIHLEDIISYAKVSSYNKLSIIFYIIRSSTSKSLLEKSW